MLPSLILHADGRVRAPNSQARELLNLTQETPEWLRALAPVLCASRDGRVWYTDLPEAEASVGCGIQARVHPLDPSGEAVRISFQYATATAPRVPLLELRERVITSLLEHEPLDHVLRTVALALEEALPGCIALVGEGDSGRSRLIGGSDSARAIVYALEAGGVHLDYVRCTGIALEGGAIPTVADDAGGCWPLVCGAAPHARLHAWSRCSIRQARGDCLGSIYLLYGQGAVKLPGHDRILTEFAGLASLALAFHRVLQRARHEARHDGLTGLMNRRGLIALMREELENGQRRRRTAVLLLDLDNFKEINDGHGHGVGDSVLTVVADRLLSGVRPGDEVARLGGDEFVVVMRDIDAAASQHVAGRLLNALREPLEIDGITVRMTPSIGLAFSGDFSGLSAEGLLEEADSAMYEAKNAGKDGLRIAGERELARRTDTHLLAEMTDARIVDQRLVMDAWPRWAGDVLTGRQLVLQWWDEEAGEQRPVHALLRGVQSPEIRARMETAARNAVRARLDPAWFHDGMTVAVRPPRAALLDKEYAAFLASCLREKQALAPQMELDISGIAGDSPVSVRAAVDRLREELPGIGIALRVLEGPALSVGLVEAVRPDVFRVSPRDLLARTDGNIDYRVMIEAMCSLARACRATVVGDHVSSQAERDLLLAAGVDVWQGPYRPIGE